MNLRHVVILLVVAALFGAGRWSLHRPIGHAAGVLVESDPQQSEPASHAPITHGEYVLTPLADYAIEARVISREDYSLDAGSDLAPTDLAVGWRRMSDTAVIDQLDIEQSARFFTYRWPDAPPIPLVAIERSSANMHMIPSDENVARDLGKLREGAIVRMRGQLVAAQRNDGFHWRSSLTRNDTGGGACELFLVTSIEQL